MGGPVLPSPFAVAPKRGGEQQLAASPFQALEGNQIETLCSEAKLILNQSWHFKSCRHFLWGVYQGESKILQGTIWATSQDPEDSGFTRLRPEDVLIVRERDDRAGGRAGTHGNHAWGALRPIARAWPCLEGSILPFPTLIPFPPVLAWVQSPSSLGTGCIRRDGCVPLAGWHGGAGAHVPHSALAPAVRRLRKENRNEHPRRQGWSEGPRRARPEGRVVRGRAQGSFAFRPDRHTFLPLAAHLESAVPSSRAII